MRDYVMVVSAPEDQNNILTNEVKIIEGEPYCMVNGEMVEMGKAGESVAAYISERSDSFMVPIRFVSNGLGIPDYQITWVQSDKSVTITMPNGRVIKFTVDSDVVVDNGVERHMVTGSKSVSPEMKGDRVYIPFRKLGELFGIEVTWAPADSASGGKNAAYYNKGVYSANN